MADTAQIIETVIGSKPSPALVSHIMAVTAACGCPPTDPLYPMVIMLEAEHMALSAIPRRIAEAAAAADAMGAATVARIEATAAAARERADAELAAHAASLFTSDVLRSATERAAWRGASFGTWNLALGAAAAVSVVAAVAIVGQIVLARVVMEQASRVGDIAAAVATATSAAQATQIAGGVYRARTPGEWKQLVELMDDQDICLKSRRINYATKEVEVLSRGPSGTSCQSEADYAGIGFPYPQVPR